MKWTEMNRCGKGTNSGLLALIVVGLAIVAGVVAVVRFDVRGEKGSGLSRDYVYDTADLGKFDPKLILYDESIRPIATNFSESRGLAVGLGGDIFVAGDRAVHVFGEGGVLKRDVDLDGQPGCVCAGDDDTVYIGMRGHIEVYDSEMKRLAAWGSLGEKAVLTSIAVSKADVFVADAGNRVVLRYDRSGKLVKRIGEKDAERNIPGFVIPSAYFDVAMGSDGLLRVTDPGRHRIEAYTVDGDLEFWWGKISMDVDGFCGCCNPVNFAILPDGSFVTSEKGLMRVKIYDPQGEFVGVVAGPEQLVETGTARIGVTPSEDTARGFDVAVDGRGRVLVLDTIKNTVRIFTRRQGS